ncbi:hypothetical protein JOB18_021476 [Solea senegalensis]|uniref:Uncharacterized protein n=1 Tax=Solea senegalensis TaxID=28829 RepID=A0AAV6S1L5_SOLSE|nr:hypothetical protein JOB18_021476 [Solea senegalensis]
MNRCRYVNGQICIGIKSCVFDIFIFTVQHVFLPDRYLSLEASGYFADSLHFESNKLTGRCQPRHRKTASSSSSMVCLHPRAVTFSCVRSMNLSLLSSHRGCTSKHCHSLTQVLLASLNPYEEKPTFSLSPVVGRRGGVDFSPGLSCLFYSFPAFPSLFTSDSYKSSLNGLRNLKD